MISDTPLSKARVVGTCSLRGCGTESKTRLLQSPSLNPLSFGLSPLWAQAFHLFLPTLVPSCPFFLSLCALGVLSPDWTQVAWRWTVPEAQGSGPRTGLTWDSALELGRFPGGAVRMLIAKA